MSIVEGIFAALRASGANGATMADIRAYAGDRTSVSSLVGDLVRSGRVFKSGPKAHVWYFLSAADAAAFPLVDHIEKRRAAAHAVRKEYWQRKTAERGEARAAARMVRKAAAALQPRAVAVKPKPFELAPFPFITVPVSNANTPWRNDHPSRKGQPRGKHEPVPIRIPAGMVVLRAPHGQAHRHSVRHDEVPLVFSALRPGQYLEPA